jgi:hypothetical protein
MTSNADRLYDLLPAVYRTRDAAQGYPLRALLNVIAEQVNIVEADIAQLYENWFIETCQDWVVPYIGALIGYAPVEDAAQLGSKTTARAQTRESILISRSEVANTVRYRRRKGTLPILEALARSVAGWPASAVEFYRLVGITQNISYRHLKRGSTADLRNGKRLERLGGPFDKMAHSVDIRRIDSQHTRGRFNTPSIGLFVWRLQSYSVTQAHAYCYEEEAPNCYLFSQLGNGTPLYNSPRPTSASAMLTELNFPTPILRSDLEPQQTIREIAPAAPDISQYYGAGKSFQIWLGSLSHPVPASDIIAADLTDWTYRPQAGQVAVDPQLGRITFPAGHSRKQVVWVSYNYAFSAGIGGGEYDRTLSEPTAASIYLVGANETHHRINEALAQWQREAPQHAVVEITDSGLYTEQINVTLNDGQTLQLRAANRKRPVIRLLDWQTEAPDDMTVIGGTNTWFVLDGLVITGRGIEIQGSLTGFTLRHSTLVPGWGLNADNHPKSTEASLELIDAPACLTIEHSIIGSIQVTRDEAKLDPLPVHISDSILDATSPRHVALGAPGKECAYTTLHIVRSTVFGRVHTQAVTLASNSIFMGTVFVCRLQKGCMRFCYVMPSSRTPRRYECQPDMVSQAVAALPAAGITPEERARLLASEQLRVEPEFNSTRYGTPDYCQLAPSCAPEISAGADDDSEMGVFHDLYQPQRAANLATRAAEYTPAGMDVGIIYAN